MSKTLVFDTLKYAIMLGNGGVQQPIVYADALAEAMSQNIYTKDEVTYMIEAALKRFDQRTHQMTLESERSIAKTQLEMKEIETRFERAINSAFNRSVGILGGFIVIVGAASSFAHYLIH